MNSVNFIFSISLFINLLSKYCVICVGSWSYKDAVNGPSTWSKTYPKCGGKMQSPINVVSKNAVFDGSFSDLNIRYSSLVDVNLTNTGKAIAATFLYSGHKLNFTGAGLKSSYGLHHIHFHIGADASKGSEHQIDGRKYPMEMHFVHYDVKNSSDFPVAVISVLVTQGKSPNKHFDKLIDNLQNCSYKGDSTKLLSFSIQDILPSSYQAFYRYSGSFTTPDCTENVEWIVLHKTVSLSSTQLQGFRNVYSSTRQDTKPPVKLVDNFRPVQPLNGRIVLRNFDHPKFICGKKSNLTADCRTTIDGHDVFYEVEINPCSLPVTAAMKINVAGLGFNYEKTISEDTSSPVPIANLKYSMSVEMHFHEKGPQAGKLHVTVSEFPSSQVTNKKKVIDQYFQVEGICKRGNCTIDSWDKHWCSSKIGVEKPLLVGFSSKLISPCGSPSLIVDVYRSEFMKQAWVLTAKQEFKDKQTYFVNLTRSLVGQRSVRMRKAIPDYSAVYLEAKIKKVSDEKVSFEVCLLEKSNGGHYRVFNTQYKYPSTDYCSKDASGNHGNKVAVGVIIAVVMVIIIGVAAYLVYRNRRNYFGHRPALVDEIEVQDADRL